MPLHLIKLSVGASSVDDLARWQKNRLADQKKAGVKPQLFHATLQSPRREDELLDGGSLYWVIKGVIQARQRLVGFEAGTREDGRKCCLILLDKKLVPVRAQRRRAFQGWRYLSPEDAPADLTNGRNDAGEIPAKMARELAELCLL